MRVLLTFLAALLLAANAAAIDNVDFELNLSGNRTSNLVDDSSETYDGYFVNSARLNLYPIPFGEILVKGEYSYYNRTEAIRNYMLGAGLSVIPIGDTAGTAVQLSFDFETRDYESDSLNFNTTDDWTITTAVGHRLRPTTHIRGGVTFRKKHYSGSDVDDKNTFEIFTGVNLSMFGSSSLDIEAGVILGNLVYVDHIRYLEESSFPPPRAIRPGQYYSDSAASDGSLSELWIAPRYAFRVAEHTGISLSLFHRSFMHLPDNSAIYGFSVTTSPWSNEYEGNGVTLMVKSYIVPRLILSGGLGYFDRRYIDHLEKVNLNPLDPDVRQLTIPRSVMPREDEQFKGYLAFQLPFTDRRGLFVEPQLQLEYTDNSSTISVYEYTDWTVSLGLTVRL
jgi:hypothetical protein